MAAVVSNNPGNFANRPTEEVRAAAHKGGLAAHGITEEPVTNTNTNPGNFANRPTEEVREIARKGGLAAHGITEQEQEPVNTNPGNFANRPTEEVREIARKGGLASHASNSDDGNINTDGGNEVFSEVKTRSSGVKATANTNPGNFANRPTEEVRAAASKGGIAAAAAKAENE